MADLVDRATKVLRQGAPLTAEELSTELEVDLEFLEHAPNAPASRAELLRETRYRKEPSVRRPRRMLVRWARHLVNHGACAESQTLRSERCLGAKPEVRVMLRSLAGFALVVPHNLEQNSL